MPYQGGASATRIPYRLAAALIGAAGLLALIAPAGAQGFVTIENTTSVGGQTSWLESFASTGHNGDQADAKRIRMTVLVRHDVGQQATGLKIDHNWDGTDNTPGLAATTSGMDIERPTISGGYGYTRISYVLTQSDPPLSNRRANLPLRIRAVLNDGQQSATSVSNVDFTGANQDTGNQDYPYMKTWPTSGGNFNRVLTPGGNITFTYTCDDPDINLFSSDDECDGVRWRVRNMNTGATTSPQHDCDGGDDNGDKTTNVTFPDRGRFVVEAELLNEGNNCAGSGPNAGVWWPIGTVDVNSTAAPSIALSSTRVPNGPTTAIATIGTDADNADGGRPEYVEWDLDDNGSFETTTLSSTTETGLVDELPGMAGLQVTKVVPSNRASGTYDFNARVVDNGAMAAADNLRRTSATATGTYQGNTPPVANNQTVTTESDASEAVTLTASDPVNGDSIASYNVTSQPPAGEGTVTPAGSGGAARNYNPSGTFAGPTSFQFTATDSVGGTTGTDATPATVTVNVTPQTQIDSTPPANSSSSDATFTFSSPVTTPGVTFECRIDSTLESDFTACNNPRPYVGLTDAQHTFEVRARIGTLVDPTPASYTWTLDGTVPETTITGTPPNPSNDISPTFTFTSDEDPNADFECRVDSDQEVNFAPCTNPYTFGAPEGEHTFEVRAVDEFGRRDPIPASYTWRVDTTVPTVTFQETPPNPSNSASAHFEFSSTDLTATFECRLDPTGPGGWTSCDSPEDFASLLEGPHTFEVRATDTATNVGPVASYAWTIDLTTPETDLLTGPPNSSASSVATFTFDSPDDPTAAFECRIDSNLSADWEECSSAQLYADLDDGPHTFEVRATDAAGNKDATPESQTWTIDTTAPQTTIDGGPSGTTGEVDATFEFSSDEDPDATFECRLDEAAFTSCDDPQPYTGLGPGSHTFRVRATDSLNNVEGTPAVRTWVIDTGAPTATIDSAPSDPSGSDEATFEFSADEDATFECRLNGEVVDGGTGWVDCDSPESYTDLEDGDNTFDVRATDGVDNEGSVASHTWEVDTTAPDVSITTGMPDTTSSTSASFSFTSTDGDATFQCRLDGGGWQNCDSPKNYTGLDEDEYTFEVRSRDDVNNTSAPVSDTWTVVDSDAPDTTIASRPDDPTLATTATFEFSADEMSDFTCQLNSQPTEPCGTDATSGTKTYPNLPTGTHTFKVFATDQDGNADQSPATDTWTVSAPPQPPQPPAPSGGSGQLGQTAASKAPVITAATGKLKLGGRVTAGTITCGTAACTVKGKAKVKINGTSYTLRTRMPASIPAGGTASIAVVASKAARTALASAAKGILTVKLAVSSASGNTAKKIKLKVKK